MHNFWRWAHQPGFQNKVQILGLLFICITLVSLGWVFHVHPVQGNSDSPLSSPQIRVTETQSLNSLALTDFSSVQQITGITRLAQMHTVLPKHPRFEITQYTVQSGDTIFDIAQKFDIKPSTILWGNLNTLADNPEMIYPDQVLNILPVDGIYYQWHENDSLNKVAQVYQVNPEDIIDFPGNHLDQETIGDYSHPNIPVGTWIIVPGGYRSFITWSAPTISRFNPGSAHIYGPGACSKPTDGAVGTGTFTWPTVMHWLSGYDYTPEANHPAVDVAGSMGNAIYAADNGVVVYAGWNDWGYGNVTVIDHGNGYQTLYAHQSQIRVGCGQSVFKGDLIGNMGSTGNSSGPHLHFEMWYSGVHVNPHDYLPFESRAK